MNEIYSVDAITSLLAEIWTIHRHDTFPQYLRDISAYTATEPVSFDCIYISQAESGVIDNAILKSAIKWWLVDDNGIRTCDRPSSLNDIYDKESTRRGLYLTPVIRFYCEGDRILIGESYGPEVFSRKTARLANRDGKIVLFDVRIILTHDML